MICKDPARRTHDRAARRWRCMTTSGATGGCATPGVWAPSGPRRLRSSLHLRKRNGTVAPMPPSPMPTSSRSAASANYGFPKATPTALRSWPMSPLWLCHEPEIFLAVLIKSQPTGFLCCRPIKPRSAGRWQRLRLALSVFRALCDLLRQEDGKCEPALALLRVGVKPRSVHRRAEAGHQQRNAC